MAARYRVVDLTAETATMAADRPTEVDPEDVARQLKDISDAIGPALTDAAPTGSFGLDSIELTLTIGAEGAVWFVAKGSAEASVKLTFKRRSVDSAG